jgi:hypothetical protein
MIKRHSPDPLYLLVLPFSTEFSLIRKRTLVQGTRRKGGHGPEKPVFARARDPENRLPRYPAERRSPVCFFKKNQNPTRR